MNLVLHADSHFKQTTQLLLILDRQEFFCPMTLAITLLFTLNLYLKLQRA